MERKIPTLTYNILSQQSIENLYLMYKSKNIIDIEIEIERRLVSCDTNLSVPVIKFLYINKDDNIIKEWLNSIYVKRGISSAIECIPWKIGVIYDYTDQSYRINNISIILGKPIPYKTKDGRYYKPTWLNANETKLMLREVISSYSRPINNNISVVTHNVELDNAIRNNLLNNDIANITVCLILPPFGNTFRSFSDYHPLPEAKAIYPFHINTEGFSHDLININNFVESQEYRVKITKTDDVIQLLELYQTIKNE